MPVRKLGRRPHNHRYTAALIAKSAPHISRLPPAPPVVDWTRDMPDDWGMYMNGSVTGAPDELVLGDCTAAAVAHAYELWGSYCPPYTPMSDAECLALYVATGGYVVGDPSTDNGAVMATVLDYWLRHGVMVGGQLDKLTSYCAIDPKNHDHVRSALFVFGSLDVGVDLHAANETEREWRDITSPNIGGHDILVAGATDTGPVISISWGQRQPLTWEWWDACVVECYPLYSDRWDPSGNAPQGFARDDLIADMEELRQDWAA